MKCPPCGGTNGIVISPLESIDDEAAGEGVQIQREQEYGVRNPRTLRHPKLPTKNEVEDHYKTHLPYRSWCRYCVEGKGKMAPHFKQEHREDGMPEVHFDYCFMSTEGAPLATILVAR